MSAYVPIADRLVAKSSFNPKTHCVEWIGSIDRHGYGKINGGKDMPGETLAHRAAFRCWSGDIPEGCDVDHRCENTKCINPGHLQAIARTVHIKYGDYKTNHRNRQKTHCIKGHAFDQENTLMSPPSGPSSHRYCRKCLAERKSRCKQPNV